MIESGECSFRKTAQRFCVSTSYVQKLVAQKQTQGHLLPRKQGGSVSSAIQYKTQLLALVEQHPDATLAQYCERLFDETGLWVSQSTMCRLLQGLNLPRKKTLRATQATTERVQRLRVEYWSQVKQVALENLVKHDSPLTR